MKNKKLILAIFIVVMTGLYFVSTYTTGERLCRKLNLEYAEKVIVAYDNGGTANGKENYTVTLTQEEKKQLLDYIRNCRLKKHRDDYISVNSWEMYAFDFQFDSGRTVVYLYGDEFINVISTFEKYSVKYNIQK